MCVFVRHGFVALMLTSPILAKQWHFFGRDNFTINVFYGLYEYFAFVLDYYQISFVKSKHSFHKWRISIFDENAGNIVVIVVNSHASCSLQTI